MGTRYVGEILIAINPYVDLNLYSEEFTNLYRGIKSKESLAPHIFRVADCSYQTMLRTEASQVTSCGNHGFSPIVLLA